MKQKLRMISWIPAVVLMVIIFQFSSKNGVESTNTSHRISEPVLSCVEKIFHLELDSTKRESVLEQIDFVVRKGAHMTEYLVLALLVGFCLWTWNLSNQKLYVWMVMITIFYAATDEFHQLFVPGRSGMIRDVLIDGIGALLGMLLLKMIETKKEN